MWPWTDEMRLAAMVLCVVLALVWVWGFFCGQATQGVLQR